MKTGIFYHEVLSQYTWSIILNKLKNFPSLIRELATLPNVILYEMKQVSQALLLKVHTEEMLANVKSYTNYIAGIYSAGGCVEAVEEIFRGKIKNAFLALSCCHHASPSYAWGGCTVSGTGPMVVNLREKFKVGPIAILDTDSHHGDGVRAIFRGDKEILHVCFCSSDKIEDGGTKVCVDVGWKTIDEEYLKKVKKGFVSRAKEFRPNLIFHILGHDTAQGDYGDRGLSWDFFPELVKVIKRCADEICEGRYIVGLGGGSRHEIADYITSKIVRILAELE